MKKALIFVLALVMTMSLVACGDDGELESVSKDLSSASDEGSDLEWVVYWYLCGSDLETEYGAATYDLDEMLEVELPDNVKVIIQTGGAEEWQNDIVDPDKMQRYVYDSEGLFLIEEKAPENMGDPQTLANFLEFANENYPAKRTMVSFWNHGGGSVTGAAFDEQFGMDSLDLIEMYGAFTSVYEENPDDQPIDIIGFDTCLMATIDTAFTFSDIGKYLVASEELEPGNGWLYSGFLGELADNPTMDALELSKSICDTYQEGCEMEGTEDDITLSVTNLSKVNDLLLAYDEFGKEALSVAVENPAFFAHFAKVANSIENYGGNTRSQGFTNMADLGHLAKKSAKLLPESYQAVVDALNYCVEYKINGKYRPESMGLACYYSYNGDVDEYNKYTEIGPSEAFKHLYAYNLMGDLSDQGMEYIWDMDYETLPEPVTLSSVDWEDMPVTVDDEGFSTLTLGKEADDILASISFELYYVDPEEDLMLCLGVDDDIIADWDNGIFKDNFRAVWGSIDGELCYMELAYMGEDYNEYSVPILLNGEDYNLMVIYDFNTEEYYIEGARKPLDESGAADKNLRYLVEGDEIQTIHYASSISDEDEDFMEVPIDTIIVTPEISFYETELGDGMFIMMYVMEDTRGNLMYSDMVTFEIIDDEIYTTVD